MEITLTWHWWYAPAIAWIVGHLWAMKVAKNSQPGIFPDPAPAIIVCGSIVTTIALIVGHYL